MLIFDIIEERVGEREAKKYMDSEITITLDGEELEFIKIAWKKYINYATENPKNIDKDMLFYFARVYAKLDEPLNKIEKERLEGW